MRISFLGGASEVGRQSFLVAAHTRTLLLDHGVRPGADGPDRLPATPPPLDAVLLSHGHLDHCGGLPHLMADGEVPVLASHTSRDLTMLLLEDGMRIAEREGRPHPYTHEAMQRSRAAFAPVRPGETVDLGGLEVTAHRAGHIPGALQFQVHAERELLLSGDLNTSSTALVKRATVPECDVLVLESTYGGRRLPARQAEEARLVRIIEETVERGGTCVLAAFAIGRTQELLLAVTEKTRFRPWVDGLGGRVLDLFLAAPQDLADRHALKRARSRARFVRGPRDRAQAARSGGVVITTSGMLEGGPVVYYLERLARDPRNALVLTGHQVEGTRGARLLATGRYPHPQRGDIPLHLRVEHVQLSAHPDHDALVRFAQATRAEDIVLVHGDDAARAALAAALAPAARVHVPQNGDTLTL